jgi:hypothetical protein
MSDTESQDRHAAPPEELESYEPPRIETLGTVAELTTGTGAGGGDTDTISGM